MDKKEKYINYVVEDLVSKTEIDYEQGKIKFPFYSSTLPLPTTLPSFISLPLFFSFSNYIKEKYGAHSEEIEIIWKLYKERIKDKQ